MSEREVADRLHQLRVRLYWLKVERSLVADMPRPEVFLPPIDDDIASVKAAIARLEGGN